MTECMHTQWRNDGGKKLNIKKARVIVTADMGA